MSFTQYIEQKKRQKIFTETKESMRKSGKISKAALYAANQYVLKTYGVAI